MSICRPAGENATAATFDPVEKLRSPLLPIEADHRQLAAKVGQIEHLDPRWTDARRDAGHGRRQADPIGRERVEAIYTRRPAGMLIVRCPARMTTVFRFLCVSSSSWLVESTEVTGWGCDRLSLEARVSPPP